MSTANNQAGFSLLEILVASFVFALMASVAVTLLSASVQGSEQVDGARDRVGSLDRMRVMLRDDMGQLTLRPVREADGLRDPVVFAAATGGVRRPIPPISSCSSSRVVARLIPAPAGHAVR